MSDIARKESLFYRDLRDRIDRARHEIPLKYDLAPGDQVKADLADAIGLLRQRMAGVRETETLHTPSGAGLTLLNNCSSPPECWGDIDRSLRDALHYADVAEEWIRTSAAAPSTQSGPPSCRQRSLDARLRAEATCLGLLETALQTVAALEAGTARH